MQILKTRLFDKWARKERLSDALLKNAITEMESGIIDTAIGAGIYKKRIPLIGRGKRGGARCIIAYKTHSKAFFIFGYAKNARENITQEERRIIKSLADEVLNYTPEQLKILVKDKKLIEVNHDG